MNIFAIDLGNKRVKMKSDRAEYNYPSSYLNLEDLSSGGVGSIYSDINHSYLLDDDTNNTFIWGEDLGRYNLPEKLIDTYARSGRMNLKKTQRLLKFSLGRLAMDYREAKSETLKVHLVMGLPITDLHQENKTVQVLKKLVVGVHSIKIDGQEVCLEIPSEDYISIIPQYMGTVIDLAFDDAMTRIDTYANGRIGVLDIGGGTLLSNFSNSLNPAPMGEERFEGIQTVIKEIAVKANSTRLFMIENLLRNAVKVEEYIYRPNRNDSDSKDITQIVRQSIDRYTRFIVSTFITETFPDLEDVDLIVVTGGGANVISKDALLDEIGEKYYNRLVFISNPEQANVNGFYKSGFLTWKEQNKEEKIPSTTIELESRETLSPAAEGTLNDENSDYLKQLSAAQKSLERLQEEVSEEL